jgi:hypothetical protein
MPLLRDAAIIVVFWACAASGRAEVSDNALFLVTPLAGRAYPLATRPEPRKVVVHYGPGGLLSESKEQWVLSAAAGDTVEIRGPCFSACTLVVSYIPRERLCFDRRGRLAFHLARDRFESGEWPNLNATKELVESYPADIRAWMDARGGFLQLPYNGFWELPALELWAMGYRRCPG